jgi:magnesium-transporting ATPase (P-type)
VLFLLSSNIGEILVMFVGILIGLPVPLLAIQILWVNLLTDGLPAIALGFEPAEPDLMKRPPRPKSESIFARGVGRRIIFRSTLLAILTLGAFVYGHAAHNLDPLSRTLGVEYLTAAQLSELTEGDVPENWDNLSEAERREILRPAGTAESMGGHSEGGESLLDKVEHLPRTIAFTVLALGQIFHVLAIHAGDHTLLVEVWFRKNKFMLYAILGTVALQFAVIYVPFLQNIFETYPVAPDELLVSIGIASIMFFVVEAGKLVARQRGSTEHIAPGAQQA